MKKLFVALLLLSHLLVHAQEEVSTGSNATELDEVVVTADTQIETAKR